MTKVNFGLTLPNRGPIILPGKITVEELLQMATLGEESGFSSVWVGDSILAKPRLEALTLLGALAARTRSSKLGVACMASLALRNPIQLAQAWATLDVLSSGRMILAACMGGGSREAGGDFLSEFDVFGVNYHERASIMEESVELMRKLWTGDRVYYGGKHYRIDGVSLQPKPIQESPPIWIVSNPHFFKVKQEMEERGLRRVAMTGDGWMSTLLTPEQFAVGWEKICNYSREAGRSPDSIHPCLYYDINLDADRERALDQSKLFLDAYYMADYPKSVLGMWVAMGTRRDCISRIDEFVSAGARTITLRFTSLDQMGQLEKCVREILSSF